VFIDTHVHLQREEFASDRQQVLARAAAAGVARVVVVGYDFHSSETALSLARTRPELVATIGIHPHDAALLADARGKVTEKGRTALAGLAELARDPCVVAIGEIGLDFYRDLSPRLAQRTALSLQLELAERLGKPVVFHVRDAGSELLAFLAASGPPRQGGVWHAFGADSRGLGPDMIASARRLGLMLGIGGPVTYRNSRLPELLGQLRPEEILLETDAPWLPPEPHRGQRNEPAYLAFTAARVAEVLGVTTDELGRMTTRNAERLFGVWPRA
jgi:TatD DNase family protein